MRNKGFQWNSRLNKDGKPEKTTRKGAPVETIYLKSAKSKTIQTYYRLKITNFRTYLTK